VLVSIFIPVVLEAVFHIDMHDLMKKPVTRWIFAMVWLFMACWAFRDVLASNGHSVDAIIGFLFCSGGVIYHVRPRRNQDQNTSGSTVFCSKCGAQSSDDARYCYKCGSMLRTPA
jgi:hypothetical protein